MSAKALLVATVLLAGAPALAQTADPLTELARSVTLATSDALTLVEEHHGALSSRNLRIGDVYKDGWALTAISGSTATLTKGRQVRTVTLGSSAAPATDQAAAAAAAPRQVNLSNAVAGERIKQPTQPADRARIQAAITAGDARGVFGLGGSATDVAKALAANGGPMAQLLQNATSASFLNMGGRTGITVENADNPGRRGVLIPPELAGVESPADAVVMNPPTPGPGTTIGTDGNGNTLIQRRLAQ